jgi:hypothetical protein
VDIRALGGKFCRAIGADDEALRDCFVGRDIPRAAGGER